VAATLAASRLAAERRQLVSSALWQLGAETASVWERVAQRAGHEAAEREKASGAAAAPPPPAAGGLPAPPAPVTPPTQTLPVLLQHNAQALAVTRWLRCVARAYAHSLAARHGALAAQAACGGAAADASPASAVADAAGELDAGALPLLCHAHEFVSHTCAALAAVRPGCLALGVGPRPGEAAPAPADAQPWLRALGEQLDSVLGWLANLKAAAVAQACPRASAACGVAAALLTEAFFEGSESALGLRRQWLLDHQSAAGEAEALWPSPCSGAELGTALGASAVMAAVLASWAAAGSSA